MGTFEAPVLAARFSKGVHLAPEMAAVLHLWDDMYWQFFSTERSEIDLLIQAHAGDPALDLHHVDFDQEYPHPSNRPLRHV